MPGARDFSVVLFLVLFLITVYLRLNDRLSGAAFVAAIPAIAFAVLTMHNLDIIQRMGFKTGGVEATVEMRQIRDDVYAKAEQVARMGEQVGSMIAWSVSQSNRFVGDDFQERLLQQREQLRKMLQELDLDPAKQERIVAPITAIVRRDLAGDIQSEVHRLASQSPERTPDERRAMTDDFKRVLEELEPQVGLANLPGLVEKYGLTSEYLDHALRRYHAYVEENRLMAPPERPDRKKP